MAHIALYALDCRHPHTASGRARTGDAAAAPGYRRAGARPRRGFLRGAQGRRTCSLSACSIRDAALLRGYGDPDKVPETVRSRISPRCWTRPSRGGRRLYQYADHPPVVEAAARRKLHVMMEKPLARRATPTRSGSSARPRKVASRCWWNFETTGTPATARCGLAEGARRAAGEIRKMVVMDGHNGPQAIKVQPEFLDLAPDPVRNGGGALLISAATAPT